MSKCACVTLTLCILKFDLTQSVRIPTDVVTFPVHSVCLLTKKLRHLAGRCRHYLQIDFFFFFGGGGR